MSDFVNPVNLDLVRSASVMPDPWVVCSRKNLDIWSEIPQGYRKWVIDPVKGDHVAEMEQAEKDSADAAILEAERDAATARLDDTEQILHAVLVVILDEINILRAQQGLDARTVAQLRAVVRGKLGT